MAAAALANLSVVPMVLHNDGVSSTYYSQAVFAKRGWRILITLNGQLSEHIDINTLP